MPSFAKYWGYSKSSTTKSHQAHVFERKIIPYYFRCTYVLENAIIGGVLVRVSTLILRGQWFEPQQSFIKDFLIFFKQKVLAAYLLEDQH